MLSDKRNRFSGISLKLYLLVLILLVPFGLIMITIAGQVNQSARFWIDKHSVTVDSQIDQLWKVSINSLEETVTFLSNLSIVEQSTLAYLTQSQSFDRFALSAQLDQAIHSFQLDFTAISIPSEDKTFKQLVLLWKGQSYPEFSDAILKKTFIGFPMLTITKNKENNMLYLVKHIPIALTKQDGTEQPIGILSGGFKVDNPLIRQIKERCGDPKIEISLIVNDWVAASTNDDLYHKWVAFDANGQLELSVLQKDKQSLEIIKESPVDAGSANAPSNSSSADTVGKSSGANPTEGAKEGNTFKGNGDATEIVHTQFLTSFPASDGTTNQSAWMLMIWVVFLFFFVLGIILSSAFSAAIRNPILHLIESLTQWSAQEKWKPIPYHGTDEIALLIELVGTSMEDIRKTMEKNQEELDKIKHQIAKATV